LGDDELRALAESRVRASALEARRVEETFWKIFAVAIGGTALILFVGYAVVIALTLDGDW
jgi:hypothetical protein